MLDRLPRSAFEIVVAHLSASDLAQSAFVCREWRKRLTARADRFLELRWWRECVLLQWEATAAKKLLAAGPTRCELKRFCWRTEYPRVFNETASTRVLPPRPRGPRKERVWEEIEKTPEELREEFKLLRNKKPKGKRPTHYDVRQRGDADGAKEYSLYDCFH